MSVEATSRLRMWGYCLVLTAVAFVQAPGRIVGDTKFDLVVDPAGFLARAANLWDPDAAFGQIQNQAYGYFWPMGPFFVLGDLSGLPAWVVQRLWWAVLLCLAFVGTVKLARALGLGRPWTRVVAGFAFALSAHVLTLLGPTSVEAWPTAWAPWVLLPLVHGARGGPVRRWAALSALAVVMCGGVNAVAVSAVLPLPLLWLLTREQGARTWRLFGWWVLFVVVGTVWWVVPLLVMGRYSVPFLDYIENAPITTLPTGLPDVLGGTADWVAYIAPEDWEAGYLLATTPILLLNLAAIAAAGLVGVLLRDNPHRHFLFLGVLAGVVLVTFGYTGPLHGWWADERLALLDDELAAFRNLHKYDVVLRLALVLGLSHFLAATAEVARTASEKLPARMLVLGVVVSVAGAAAPTYAARLAPDGSFEAVPDYWAETADYLAQHDRGVALVLPASAFGDYAWGSPHDDVLQPLATSPWAARNVVPLAQPGNVRLLDAVTEVLEEGRPSDTLAAFLVRNGVGHLVIRNDLSPVRSDPPDRVVVHQVLDRSPGLTRVAGFGPTVGETAVTYTDQGTRVLANRGRAAAYQAVEIYALDGADGQVSAWSVPSVPVVAGGPAAFLALDDARLSGVSILAGDETAAFARSPRVLTDDLRRRETAFTSVRNNESATMAPGEPWTLSSVVPNHRLYEDQAPYETVVRWAGVAGVRASSAQSEAATVPPIRRDRSPAAAVDGDTTTAWVSRGLDGAVGQWWRVRLRRPIVLRQVSIRTGSAVGPPVTRLRLRTDDGSRVVRAPRPGRTSVFSLPDAPTSFVEIRAARVRGGGAGVHFTLAEVDLRGVAPERFLVTPSVFERVPEHVVLRRGQGRSACAVVGSTTVCDDFWDSAGEERSALRRIVTLPGAATYDVALTASARTGVGAVRALSAVLPVQVRTSPSLSRDLRGSGLAAIDSDLATTWVSAPAQPEPYLALRWDEPVRLANISFGLSRGAPGASPTEVALIAGDEVRRVALDDGQGSFDPLVTREVEIRFGPVEEAYSFENAQAVRLPVGVSEVSFPGADVPWPDPGQDLSLPCGSGPDLETNGVVLQTRVQADLARLMAGDPLDALTCAGARAALRAGPNVLRVTPSAFVRPRIAHLRRGSDLVVGAEPVPVSIQEWTASSRRVRVGEREVATLLVVAENINAGWEATMAGRELPRQRVNGWMQGWLVPRGSQTDVVLTFRPDRTYRLALVAGVVGVLAVLAAAAVPGARQRLPRARTSRSAPWSAVAVALLAGGLVAGWVGLAVMVLALLAGNAARAVVWGPLAAGASLLAAGVVHASSRTDGFVFHSLAAQSFALVALGLATAALGAKGPEFLRLRIGRSRRW